MNVTDFKKAISEKFQCGKSDADTIYKNFVSIISDTLVSGEEVELQGIGNLKPTTKAQRTGRNIKTGESIIIAERKSVNFKLSSTMKKKLNS